MAKKAKKKPRRIKPFWLTRDEKDEQHCQEGEYNLHNECPEISDCGTWRNCACVFDAEEFEQRAKKSVHLEPGGGPIKVKLTRAS